MAASVATTLPRDHFSIRWTGFIQAPKTGDYTLATASDDGVRLWIDDKPVIDDWNVHPLATDTAIVHFAANTHHKVRLEYYQNLFDAVMRLTWRAPGGVSVLSWKSEAADSLDYYFFYGPSLDAVLAG